MNRITDTKKPVLEKGSIVNLILGGFMVATFIGVLVSPTVAGATYNGENHPHNDEEEFEKDVPEIEEIFEDVEEELILGSIRVCKTIADSEGNLVEGEGVSGTFELSGLDFNNPAGVLPSSSFSTPLSWNADIFPNVDGDDSKCYTYDGLALGGYYYGEEVVTGDNWLAPKYSDQHTTQVNGLDDFFAYSGELFNDNESDDGERNTNADGHIVLSENRPDRTIVVLNTYEEEVPPAPYCGDEVVNQESEECDGGPECTLECKFSHADNSCPFGEKDGRIIIDFEDGRKVMSVEGYTYSGPVEALVPAGTYTVSLASFDGYENRSDNVQPQEIWNLKLKDGETFIVDSSPSTDLPDNVDFVSQIDVVNNELVVEADANSAKAWHGAQGDVSSANSVEPVCAALDLNVENHKPVITLTGDSTVLVTVGGSYSDDGATADDVEDGDITGDIVTGGDTVDTDTVGTYTITYNVDDSEGLSAEEVTRDVIVRNKARDPKQCSDRLDNDGDGLIDKLDPGCHTDGDPTNNSSYDPNDDDETHEVPYAPYCGDGLVNQDWESCDGGAECTAQCQHSNQCVELAFARVNTSNFENHVDGDASSDVFLGSLTNKIPGSAWFLLYNSGAYEVDADISGYENVPGLAVERREGKIRTLLHGSHPHNGSKEHLSGDVELFNIEVTEQLNDDSGNNKLERGFDNVMDNVPGQDEVWLKDNNNLQSFFWLTVTTADDAFYTKYGDAPMCEVENQKPVITLVGSNPLIIELFDTYTDPGATAEDLEDGDITDDIVTGGDTVDPNTEGNYVVTYNVSDSEGLDADEVTRTVSVRDTSSNPPACSDDADNDGDLVADMDDAGCHTDGDPTNPDSYDPNDDDENEIPVITLRGDSVVNVVLNGTYTEEEADVDDPEEGDIDGNLVIAGDTVDTSTLGEYTVTYNATDGDGADAVEVTRTVNVVEEIVTECSDQIDNDGDEGADTDDAGCHTDGDPTNPESYDPSDDSENEIPVITLTGDSTVDVNIGGSYIDEGATADDSEDGDITTDIVTVNPVNVDAVGVYTITYNVTDSNGADAVEVTRTVNVINPGSNPAPTPTCTSNCGGGGGGHIPDGLKIFNEKITVIGEGTALITWNTNKQATSRVVYDDDAQELGVSTLTFGTGSENLGYEFTTEIVSSLNTEHSVLVTNVNLEDLFYFRPISSDGTRAIGIELSAVLGQVTGTQCEQYLLEFIKFGDNNNSDEVRKLQEFLNDFEGATLDVNGVYDEATFAAVVVFQNKYNRDVLSPWGLQTDTGYVYLTTRKKINEIYCNFQLEFPLTAAQLAEVNQFKGLLQNLEAQGLPLPDTSNVGFAPSAPTFAGGDSEDPTVVLTEETTDGEEEDSTDSLAAAIEAVEAEDGEGGIFGRIGNFFRNLLR